ncbi:Chitin synthase, class 3 [Claviceps maximensis]|nr:Chitin synthase, class 3 [Claviceps maximensis]
MSYGQLPGNQHNMPFEYGDSRYTARSPSSAEHHPMQHHDQSPYDLSREHLASGPQRYYPSSSDQLNAYPPASQFVDDMSGHPQQSYDGDAHIYPGRLQDEYHQTYQQDYYEQHVQDTHAYDLDDRRPMLEDLTRHGSDEQYQGQQQQTPGGGLRRWKTVKPVKLYNGNLILDCPVPPVLLQQLPHGERDEFTHMRYTAATCDPSNFKRENYALRQVLFGKTRKTELFIVITMYNEDDVLFARTMIGVFKNIEYMCNRPNSKTWGKDAWKNIMVCIVSDGRAKINPRTKAILSGMGVYQEGIAKQQVNGKDVTAHIYEYTTQTHLQLRNDVVSLVHRRQPVQILFCLKEKNQKKINSHRWFFEAFGPVLEPNICVLLDAGTRPGNNSIYHLWKAFDLEPMCGGACGEIKAMLGTGGKNLLNPLVATQNFEYKMSNILDKPLESAFGFISVLPGAFSAYRYVALQNDDRGKGPLEKYFLGETLHGGSSAGLFESNMYLAEDRILCFEIVTKRKCHWILQYVKSATGETDVPDTVTELVLQRRRWLNGSFFAAIYAIAHFHDFFRSNHSILRKMAFFVEFVFNTINMIFAWFAIGNFFLVFKILTTSLGSPDLLGKTGSILGVVFTWLYGGCLVSCFVLAMGNRPAGSGKLFTAMPAFQPSSSCQISNEASGCRYLMFAAIFIAVKSVIKDLHSGAPFSASELFKNPVFYTLIISVMSTYGIWLIASIIMFDPWHMVTSFLQYILLTPTYTNVLNVYAFCNTHDVSWGTKGDDKAEKLPSVNTEKGATETEMPDSGDLNAQYQQDVALFSSKHQEVKKALTPVQLQEKQMDYYRGVRTGVVLIWMITNFALAAVVLSTGGLERITPGGDDPAKQAADRSNIYMAIVLWSVAGLSLFKFLGAMWFLIVRLFRGV